MKNCKPRSTVCEAKVDFPTENCEIVDVSKYREIVGSLIYAMTCTRPDLCWVVTKLSQYLSNPSAEHHVVVKHVLRYIKGTIGYELCYKHVEKFELFGFADADWASSSQDRKSITGYCFRLGQKSGAMISWKSRKQPTVALSTCEAEYMALSAATQEGLFLMKLLYDLGHGVKYFTLCGDNQGALSLAKNPVNHQRSKHIDIRYHFIRSECQGGRLILQYVPTQENVADVFTKPLCKSKLEYFVKMLLGF
jgi:hypothetical protein